MRHTASEIRIIMKKMKRAVAIFVLLIVVCASTMFFVACDKNEADVPQGDFLAEVAKIGTRPNYNSLFSESDVALIQKAVDGSASTDELKNAVMTLYNTANASRITENNGLSLMVQDSLGGNKMGKVYMHGFTLQSGNKWYYQLASQAAEGDVAGFESIATMMQSIAGNLQVAYTMGDGKYHYAYIMGTDTALDCSVSTFPFASFVIPEGDEPKVYDSFTEYQADRNCRDDQLELNNMRIYKKLLNDDATVEYDAQNKYYTLTFSINCSDQSCKEFQDFQAMSMLDLDIGSKIIKINNKIVGWRAEVEIWDNGYVKAFRSYENWEMKVLGIAVESNPQNEFEYLWNADEIVELITQDENLNAYLKANGIEGDMDVIDAAIDYYSDPVTVYVFDWFTFWIALSCSIVGAIIIVIVVLVILAKKGKLPRLVAWFEKVKKEDKARREAIKARDLEDKEKKKARKAEKKDARAQKRAGGAEEVLDGTQEDNIQLADDNAGDSALQAEEQNVDVAQAEQAEQVENDVESGLFEE